MTDFAMQRLNMVESQLRPSDITDRRILRAMADIAREAFVPIHMRATAYMDEDIRLTAPGQTPRRAMLAPRTLAQLIQLAEIEPAEHVLVVGAATGYEAAVVARLAGAVVALESDADLSRNAATAIAASGAGNIRMVVGELMHGHPAQAPYDAILCTGAVADVPPGLLDQLKDAGRLVAVSVIGGVGRGTIWRRNGMHYDRRAAFDARAETLPGFARQAAFTL